MKTTLTPRVYSASDLATFREQLADFDRDDAAQALAFLRTLRIADGDCVNLTGRRRELSHESLSTIGEDHDDDYGNHIYKLPNNIWVHDYQSGQNVIEHKGSLKSFIGTWDFDLPETLEETIVAFGGSPDLEEIYTAGTDDTPEAEPEESATYRIWVRYSYYSSGCGNPSDSWARDDDYATILEFDSLLAACEAADEMEAEQYTSAYGGKTLVLSHNQAGSTDFIVCKIS